MGYCAPALGYVDFRLGGVRIGWIKSVWLFNSGFDKGSFKKIINFMAGPTPQPLFWKVILSSYVLISPADP